MRFACLFLFITSFAYAQVPGTAVRRDSMPLVFPPDLMPTARPNNLFYRDQTDSKNVIRATLDNMPVKVPDSAMIYTMRQSGQPYRRPQQLFPRFLSQRQEECTKNLNELVRQGRHAVSPKDVVASI
ncbi:hypothetical protein HMF3257_35830 [Spirosoma telluris]|uniref:Uncharacterized protein n=1 Tax=Spirosoma telluris TaxID=2183553 RepID=A0A327NS91_9BACT|nr:hypothetical protein HMF3257_35830 [Spirosoma telluris]